MMNWLKSNRKKRNAGEMKETRLQQKLLNAGRAEVVL